MLSRIIAVAAITLVLAAPGLQAQTLKKNDGPAEFPPASFKGTQYVDSRGCVYIRAGVGGQVTWVPRVARNRQVVCGFQPTFAEAPPTEVQKPLDKSVVQIQPAEVPKQTAPKAAAAAPAPKPKPAAKPAQRVVTAPKAAPKPAPKPVQRTVVAPKPKPRTTQRVVRAAPAPAPRQVVRPMPTIITDEPNRQGGRPAATGGVACPGLSAVGQQYVQSKDSYPVRCGPQAEPPSVRPVRRAGDGALIGYAVGEQVFRFAAQPDGSMVATRLGSLDQVARVLPKHVYENRQNTRVGNSIPKGYRRAFKDDRLNPHRAEMTMQGIAQTELIWTNTVPRRLVRRDTGQDVTAMIANLVPPTVSSSGAVPKAASSGSATRKAFRAAPAAKPRAPAATPTAAPAPRAAPSGHRYVQVGTFGVADNANKTVARLQASGLPVAKSRYTKGGKEYQIILAGPFNDAGALSSALNTARRSGFRDAFTR